MIVAAITVGKGLNTKCAAAPLQVDVAIVGLLAHLSNQLMFKKERDLAERSKTLLKNKEVRSLKTDILKKFPNVTEEELTAFIPNKADITVTKLANKTLLYSINGVTFMFDIESRNNLCPALPFMWRFPNALPTFVIHSPVSEFVLRGADLMVPGICKSKIGDLAEAGVKEGDKVAIRVIGNPLPFAVGECLVSGAALASGKMRGRAVTVYHVYGDLILTANAVPNSGFGPSRIYALEGFTEAGADQAMESDSDDEGSDEEQGDGDAEQDGTGEAGGDAEGNADAAEQEGVQDAAKGLEGLAVDGTAEEPTETITETQEDVDAEAAAPAVSVEAMDALLLQAALLATKYIVKDKQLPMLVSTYWALLQRCAPCANLGSLNIKHSSFKKVTPFLAHCRGLELLDFKEDNGVATVTRLNKTHDLFRGVKVDNPEQFKLAVQSSTAGTGAGAGSGEASAGGGLGLNAQGGGKGGHKVQVLELFKLTKLLRDVFGTPRGEYGEYLRASEVRDILMMYIKNQDLEDPADRGSVVIPPSDAVHKLLASYSSANTTKDAKRPAAAAAVLAGTAKDTPGYAEDGPEEGYGSDGADEEVTEGLPVSGYSSLFPGLPGSSGASSSDIKMKIHSGGLRSVDDFPTLSTAPSAAQGQKPAPPASIAGGISVGGWGVDKGTVWRPVSLSTSRASATASASAATGGKASGRATSVMDSEFPTLGASAGTKGSQAASKSKGAAVYSELPTELHMRKEEVYKAILKKASPYFGVVSHNGTLSVHSGQVPKVKVMVETRMGNKAVTILRGLEVFGIDLSGLVKDCQKKFACSVALSSVPGIPKDKEIVIQGNLGHEAEGYLVSHCGVPKGLIELDTSKGAKLKKRK